MPYIFYRFKYFKLHHYDQAPFKCPTVWQTHWTEFLTVWLLDCLIHHSSPVWLSGRLILMIHFYHYWYWRYASFEVPFHPVEAITILTVITFDDEVQRGPNADEKRKRLREAAVEVTGSDMRNVFMIANSLPEQDLDPVYKKRVLKLMEKALKCGERSIKMRQTKRESPKKEIRHSESAAGELKYPTPVEHEYEPPTDRKCKSLP